jgi:GAF domain-containing protein
MQLEALQELALRISSERDVDVVLHRIVEGLAQQPDVALARVWVVKPGDICPSCRMRPSCPDQTACLHLAASAGASLTGDSWSRTDGDFQRMPIGRLKVGSIASERAGVLIVDPRSERWGRPEWVQRERIASFAGQPLIFRDETLGVLAVFRREVIDEQEFRWLRMFADQAASAIANARAFSELEKLRQQLESHNAYLKEEVETALAFGSIVGRSRALHRVLKQVEDVAATDSTVLILGESGTGKELLAKEIHERGRRAHKPFVRVNCSAIPRDMFESEFFGHVREPSPAPCATARDVFRSPTAARFSSTKSASCRSIFSQNCCVYCRKGNTSASVKTSRGELTFV